MHFEMFFFKAEIVRRHGRYRNCTVALGVAMNTGGLPEVAFKNCFTKCKNSIGKVRSRAAFGIFSPLSIHTSA